MKHIKQFENKKEKKQLYTDCLISVFNTEVSVKLNTTNTVNIKIHKYKIDEKDIKKVYSVFGPDIRFEIKQKEYSQQVILLIEYVSTEVLDTIVDQNKFNL